MDVMIHTHHNVEFPLELGFFDIVADIKLKMQSLTGISTFRQTLFHHNALLRDDSDLHDARLFHRSRIHLLIRTPDQNPNPKSNPNYINFLVQLPISKLYSTFKTSAKNRVSDIKQSIEQSTKISKSLFSLFLHGKELNDQTPIGECEGIYTDDAVVEVELVGGGGYKIDNVVVKVLVFVAPMNVTLPMSVNVTDSFGDLRRDMERLRKDGRIALPKEWFFVFRKERVMVEGFAFEKFKVRDNDVLQVRTSSKMLHHLPETPPPSIIKLDYSPNSSENVQIRLKMPSPISPIRMEMSPSDTFSKLKSKIQELENIPTTRMSLIDHTGKEVQDQASVRDFDGQEVSISVKHSPTTSIGSGASQGSKSCRLTLMVLPKNWRKRIPVEVNAGDNVAELRKELRKLQERMGFHLPADGYFFIYKQNVMEDDHSFRWHGVGQGDTIEIFNGSVTGGS